MKKWKFFHLSNNRFTSSRVDFTKRRFIRIAEEAILERFRWFAEEAICWFTEPDFWKILRLQKKLYLRLVVPIWWRFYSNFSELLKKRFQSSSADLPKKWFSTRRAVLLRRQFRSNFFVLMKKRIKESWVPKKSWHFNIDAQYTPTPRIKQEQRNIKGEDQAR